MKFESKFVGAAAISFAAILWGLDGVVLTPRLYNLDVAFVVFLLHAIPFVLMNVFLFKEYRLLKNFTKADYINFSLIAFFGGALGTLAIVKALFLVNFHNLSIVVLLQKLQPVFAIALAAMLLKEKLRKNFVFWAATALVGSYILTFGFGLPHLDTGENTALAALWALVAAISFGSATVFGKIALKRFSFQASTFFRFGFTSLFMLIFVLLTAKISWFSKITPSNWMILLIIAFTTGSGAIFVYYYGLKKVRAIVSTICELFMPVSAIVFDYLINKSILSPVQWLGALILVIAILNVSVEK